MDDSALVDVLAYVFDNWPVGQKFCYIIHIEMAVLPYEVAYDSSCIAPISKIVHKFYIQMVLHHCASADANPALYLFELRGRMFRK